jgi:hypothetical protein
VRVLKISDQAHGGSEINNVYPEKAARILVARSLRLKDWNAMIPNWGGTSEGYQYPCRKGEIVSWQVEG